MTVILDYGVGNLASVSRAIHHLGFEARIQSDLSGADRAILPGVGAFGPAMERLAPLAESIRAFAASGKPFLGICLGQQLLFENSEEMGLTPGLGILKGRVRYLPRISGFKIPHVGWNEVDWKPTARLGSGLTPGGQAYFVHSLYAECAEPADVSAETEYGIRFPAAVARGNVFGCQFHPEKSGGVGLQVLENFLRC